MGGRENFKQKENKRGRKILSAVERVHGGRGYMRKEREFEKYRGSLRKIQRGRMNVEVRRQEKIDMAEERDLRRGVSRSKKVDLTYFIFSFHFLFSF